MSSLTEEDRIFNICITTTIVVSTHARIFNQKEAGRWMMPTALMVTVTHGRAVA
jgi:hypothetical protein